MAASSAMETDNIASEYETAYVEPQFSERGKAGEHIIHFVCTVS